MCEYKAKELEPARILKRGVSMAHGPCLLAWFSRAGNRAKVLGYSQLSLGVIPKPQLLRLQLPCTSTPTRCQLSTVSTSFINLLALP